MDNLLLLVLFRFFHFCKFNFSFDQRNLAIMFNDVLYVCISGDFKLVRGAL